MTSPATLTAYEHVVIDANGVPLVAGTTMKVVQLVMAQLANGWSPEELHFQYPDITLGQIYSALAYYWDHKVMLDADIERRRQLAERTRQESGPSPLAARLRAQGLLA
jgi:uncharacterized protein (DUF433 family)